MGLDISFPKTLEVAGNKNDDQLPRNVWVQVEKVVMCFFAGG